MRWGAKIDGGFFSVGIEFGTGRRKGEEKGERGGCELAIIPPPFFSSSKHGALTFSSFVVTKQFPSFPYDGSESGSQGEGWSGLV